MITQRIKDITGSEVAAYHQLSGGCVSDVKRADLRDGRKLVIKQGSEANLEIEGRMLDYLGTHSPIPFPAVLHAEPGLLIMHFIENDGHMNGQVQSDLAVLLARQHQVTQGRFGLSFDTLIGRLDHLLSRSPSALHGPASSKLRTTARAFFITDRNPVGQTW